MSVYLSLKNIEPAVDTRVKGTTIIPRCPTIIPTYTSDSVYESFKLFITNPLVTRFGVNEKVVTRRLTDVFNETTGNNISFNLVFPKLMSRFMSEHPQYNISKKNRKEGTTYLGVGLVTDSVPFDRGTRLTPEDREKAYQDPKNEKRMQFRRETLHNMKSEILNKTGWTEINYRQLINLDFISIFPTRVGYDIEATIKVAETNIIRYIYDKISILEEVTGNAKIIKYAFEKAIDHDTVLTKLHKFPTYTNRNKVASETYIAGDGLDRKIKRYVNSTQDLPYINHIVYPDIQQLQMLADWLKINSMFRVGQAMKQEQTAIDNETVKPRTGRYTSDDLFVNHTNKTALDVQY